MLGRETLTVNPDLMPAKPSVLCIDDSPGMLTICRAILEANGYSVLTASGAKAGLEILEQKAIRAAVIDDGLKDMSAAKLAREMRKTCPGLPVVVFTRSSTPDGEITATEIYVPKASGPKALLAAIKRACESEAELQG
jgi:DNA-binding NtrC family response regulator